MKRTENVWVVVFEDWFGNEQNKSIITIDCVKSNQGSFPSLGSHLYHVMNQVQSSYNCAMSTNGLLACLQTASVTGVGN